MGLGQYNSLGEYCDPHTASSVILILLQSFGESPPPPPLKKVRSWKSTDIHEVRGSLDVKSLSVNIVVRGQVGFRGHHSPHMV